MNYIKTYWHNLEGQSKADYYLKIDRERLYMFALSSLLLIEKHPVELYTDLEGKKIIKKLKIPFFKITVIEKISNRYKSINDLYVLSLQKSPATLIEDNIMSMGNIPLHSGNLIINVLGIELDSYKLVKSLIKITRIYNKLPFNDQHLLDKMSYIDTSLLNISNPDKIKEYLDLVMDFISPKQLQLEEIENTIIDSFIKKYWLFCFFKENGYEYKIYFDDPLNVNANVKDFAFSKSNTIQNINKVLDHYFGSEEFELTFFFYFELRFGKNLKLIKKHAYSNSLQEKETDPLKRARHVLKKTSIIPQRYSHKDLTLKQMRNLAGLYSNKNEKDLALFLDALNFELYVDMVYKHYSKHSRSLHTHNMLAFEKSIKMWDRPVNEFNDVRLIINPYVYLYESSWRWGTKWLFGVPKNKMAELKALYNLPLEPSIYITAFTPHYEKGIINEFNIDRTSAEILNFFSSENSINDFFKFKEVNIDDNNTNTVNDLINIQYLNRIKDFLKVNILNFV